MELGDFAFFHQGKIVKLLDAQDAHYLSAVDRAVTSRQDHALLMIHGFASSPGVFRTLLPHITGYDRIVCPVLPGHGQSIRAFSQATAQQWRDTVADTYAKLRHDYTKISVLGLSLGGSLALELSQHAPLHHLYLLAPALKLYYPAGFAAWAAWALRALGLHTLVNHGGDIYAEYAQELSYQRLPLAVLYEILSFIHNQDAIIPTCPTDVFLGRYDNVVDVRFAAQHFAHHPNVNLHWLEHSAHVLPLDSDQDAILEAIAQ